MTKCKSFINICYWKGIKFPSGNFKWKKFEKNNAAIALNVLCSKKKKDTLLLFQNKTHAMKNQLFFK